MPRSFRHWTPRYVWNRSRLWLWERRHPDSPWLTPRAVSLLSELIRPEDRAFEWGSGRSTRWLADRTCRLISVEHDAAWHQCVSRGLAGHPRLEYRLRPCESREGAADPGYCGAIDDLREGSLDLVLIDGLFRDECARRALPKLAPGGLLILDNSNWFLPSRSHAPGSRRSGYASALWEQLARQLACWRPVWTTNGITDTTLWIRPGPR